MTKNFYKNKKDIPYGRQYIDSQDIRLVSKALKEDLITTGPYVKKFENKISDFLKVKYAASCNSGTSALHLALMVINLKKDDVIIMPAVNFIAVYNMASLINAKIFLADVDPLTGQMTPETLLECIKNYKIKKIKAFITMYLGGYPENVLNFFKIKKELKCLLIEDACHALGAKYLFNKKYLHIGSCNHSDISTFSLHPVKTITTGEGGIVTTNNKIFYEKIISLRSHNIHRHKKLYWKYDVKNIGYNYRLSDINCAIGLSQIKKIKNFLNYRKKIYNIYNDSLKNSSNFISLPNYSTNLPAYHLFLISINFKRIKKLKDKFFNFLKKNNIIAQFHYIPIYKFTIFKFKLNLGFYKGAETYYNNVVSLPIFFNLNLNSQKKIISKIKTFLKE
jgi:dTDP-4-amino-4,6-dideoxygalactose transaminase